MWNVYVLKCSNGSCYVGCTQDINERLTRHYSGQILHTKSKLQVEVVMYLCFANKYKAFEFEKYLKTGSGRAFLKKRLYRMSESLSPEYNHTLVCVN